LRKFIKKRMVKNSVELNIRPLCLIYISVLLLFFSSMCCAKAAPPKLDNRFSPIAEQNQQQLHELLVFTFDQKYAVYSRKRKDVNYTVPTGYEVYFLKREIQALVDMWKATGDKGYLKKALERTRKAIHDGMNNRQPLWHGRKYIGSYPCYLNADVVDEKNPGHSKLYDIQAAYAFMLVASELNKAGMDGWESIADFVEVNLIEKWLYRDYEITKGSQLAQEMIQSGEIVLKKMCSVRDQREMFGSVCLYMHDINRKTYPYLKWAKLLCKIYLSERESLSVEIKEDVYLSELYPKDWGVINNHKTGGLLWYWSMKNTPPFLMDTSHANRTAWFACEAYEHGLITSEHLKRFVNTLKHQIWKKDKPGFYFANMIDGTDPRIKSQGPGQRGNIWFGWHRLAAYDEELEDLFISMAYDLTNGGPNIADGTLNKFQRMAPMCLMAWGARLISGRD